MGFYLAGLLPGFSLFSFPLTLSNVNRLDFCAAVNIKVSNVHEGSQDSSRHIAGAP